MTKIADILARAARQCSVIPPSSWISTSDQTALEIRDFMDETADDVLERVDVTGPASQTITITGDGGESYDLPDDYKRLQRGQFAVYERLRTRRDCVPITDDGKWEYIKELGTAGAYRFFRVRGHEGSFEIDFQRPLETGITVVVSYVSRNWIKNDSTLKSAFDDADDVALFPRRLMESGIVWRFRERKGLEYTDKQAEYEALLARMINDTRTRRVVGFGEPVPRAPWDVPVPDVIPSS